MRSPFGIVINEEGRDGIYNPPSLSIVRWSTARSSSDNAQVQLVPSTSSGCPTGFVLAHGSFKSATSAAPAAYLIWLCGAP